MIHGLYNVTFFYIFAYNIMFYEGNENNLTFIWVSKMILHVVVAFLILFLSSLPKFPYRALISNMSSPMY